MLQIAFSDRCVTYDTFINDLTTALVPKLLEAMENPSDIISQRRAFKIFGEGNIRRWLRQGRLKPFSKRPGKIEYKLSSLRILQQRTQDYLI